MMSRTSHLSLFVPKSQDIGVNDNFLSFYKIDFQGCEMVPAAASYNLDKFYRIFAPYRWAVPK